ncbi:MAG: amidohydrolase family protein [Chitinophagaceae bacterium]
MLDTHVHFWKYDKVRDAWITDDMKLLQQDYLPQQLQLVLNNNGLNGCIAVQADQSEVETRFLVELARKYSFIKGVVGWIDLLNPDLDQRLNHFLEFPEIKGWRHVAQGEADDFLSRKEVINGIRTVTEAGYSYDILIYARQLPAAIQLVNALPEANFILDHCAKPDIRNKEIEGWAKGIREIAQHPGVSCKLSGLFTEAHWKQWSPADFYPYLDVVFEAFGTNRLMFGSDWPVILVSGMYVQWKSLLLKYMENMDDEMIEAVMGGNAQRIYRTEI